MAARQVTVKKLSTTALARAMGKDSKELFILLANSGWITKVAGHWQLTEKGRFEGGDYVNHPKFGEYIVWPEAVRHHALLTLLPEAPLGARNLAQKFNLPARLINLALAERGWLTKHIHGWLLTPAGRALGGEQHYSDSTAIPFVTWPESLLENTALGEVVRALSATHEPASHSTVTLDGHPAACAALATIDNWLYVAGVVHAVNHRLDITDAAGVNHPITVDFYLPGVGAAIVYWPAASKPGKLAEVLATRELLHDSHCAIIEIEEEHLSALDEMMARELMKNQYAVY